MIDTIENILESELKEIISTGVVGNSKDFLNWLKMSFSQKKAIWKEFDLSQIETILDKWLNSGYLERGTFDKTEFTIHVDHYSNIRNIKYTVLGKHDYSPIQYVRSRLEYFLKVNQISEETIVDISIATIEGIENAVKYGDGEEIFVSYWIDDTDKFFIQVKNKIREFDINSEIERGKYSSRITLMRGIMVMQKLFDKVDLDLVEDNQQALLSASKKVKNE